MSDTVMLEVAGRPVADYVVRPEVDPHYGGFFWRLAPGVPHAFTAAAEGE
ncbi:hypothetical protein O7543_09685 [Solwaraspora sp. WMMA2080]|nr:MULTISPECIES: hypothetical protein [unclassified Solwaraspora]WBB98762.1 hypothetical protein O7553_07680 [Solwaraspora sp. WMMA2059]WBC22685.1 hypothetical protein O7543_09685 [Solwaraspora sp. WMMA2080]